MSLFDSQQQGLNLPLNQSYGGANAYNAIAGNVSAVTNFLDRKFRRTQVHLSEAPCYFYLGNRSKLEVTVFSNPQIAKVDVRIITLKSYDREPAYEHSYDLNGLSVAMFIRSIEDLMSQMA
ncbi:MAG: hypothetical protein AAFQ41_03550 [Cyanobacteria bacterium J06623_7]